MITTYNTYIKERFDNNQYSKVVECLNKYVNKYNSLDVRKLDLGLISIINYYDDSIIIEIDLKFTFILYWNNILNTYTVYTVEEAMDKIDYFMTYFYDIIKNSKQRFDIQNIPILDYEKYCDFIAYLMEHEDYNMTYFLERYNKPTNNEIKEIFDRKYKYLLDAKNFDLI